MQTARLTKAPKRLKTETSCEPAPDRFENTALSPDDPA
jgi:hypothetical protein